ncbi:TetR/AcrR family transcriptional regulator [Rhodococcus globerulus]|uniref:TetR/AcrR family transcriptional regulator n=1 Tax=Rhodococcus globerulus TaxID=33008 RepID=UPI0030196EFD
MKPTSQTEPADTTATPPTRAVAGSRRRRKEARPGEIVDAAAALFSEKGFAATTLDEVARRTGVAKGTVYVYFDTKVDLFRAVAQAALESQQAALTSAELEIEGPFADTLPRLLSRMTATLAGGIVPTVVRMVISESRNFPDLAKIWHDEVLITLLDRVTGLVVAAQARGEVRTGDPRLYAFSIIGAVVTGLLYREVFAPVVLDSPDMTQLSEQHLQTILHGMLENPQIGINK